MPKGYKKTEDPAELLDQLAETAHRKEMESILDKFPHRDTVEGQSLVGKLRRTIGSRLAD